MAQEWLTANLKWLAINRVYDTLDPPIVTLMMCPLMFMHATLFAPQVVLHSWGGVHWGKPPPSLFASRPLLVGTILKPASYQDVTPWSHEESLGWIFHSDVFDNSYVTSFTLAFSSWRYMFRGWHCWQRSKEWSRLPISSSLGLVEVVSLWRLSQAIKKASAMGYKGDVVASVEVFNGWNAIYWTFPHGLPNI